MRTGINIGKIKQVFWHDIETLPRDGSVTLLDVRTAMEVSRGKINGFLNIPLDSLRSRLNEIPNSTLISAFSNLF